MADTPDHNPPDDAARRAPRPCPICSKMSLPEFHPFCSKRCADIDLSRWFKGVYAVPAPEAEQESPAEDDEER